MANFTTTDRNNIKAAIVQAAIDGFASVDIAGQMVANKSLDELRRILEMINQDLASDLPRGGMRMVKTIPPMAG